MSKADNMLQVLWLLKTRRRMTAREIAEALEIHVRTVYRYIDSLCASGVPIEAEAGHDGGYRLPDHFRNVPLFFDMEEQKALAHAALFAKEAGYPYGDALNRAVTKLQRYANEEQWDEVNRHLSGFEVVHAPADPRQEPFLRMLEQAVADGRTVVMEYQTGRDQTAVNRELDPYGLVHWKGKWYTVGYCHVRGEMRSFRVDRIRALSPAEAGFTRPADFSARRFLLQNLLPDPEKPEALVDVVIRGRREALNDLCDHWLFGHGLLERTGDEEARFRLQEQTVKVMVPYFLLPYGRAIRVEEPPLLQERMAEVAESLAEHYRTSANPR
ncbi:WYL domain-containing protein [Cohnella sp. CFH 77786]|uniref:helix-turn-helix transcriptional regulator n=1 Tax=Cohnella sp. CFH 77786 TaxID=2662265 RepID=UPI001C60E514|nr:YafY family protein [Cohnella sp. CFH 77786]MBW5448679.1 WYL domain-containing protein [Cohnella sp. CFH 77786]